MTGGRPIGAVTLTFLAAAALAAGGCGGEGDADDEAAADIPSTGVPAESPKEVSSCLEGEGFEVELGEVKDDGSEEGAGGEALDLLIFGKSDGGGTITYYGDLEDAAAAHKQHLDAPQPDSVTGRVEEAVYVYTGEGFAGVGTLVEGCL